MRADAQAMFDAVATSRCRASTTRRRSGATRPGGDARRASRRSASARSWSRTAPGPAHVRRRRAARSRARIASEARDTTGAGDSFNAGYLAARLFGLARSTPAPSRTGSPPKSCAGPARWRRSGRSRGCGTSCGDFTWNLPTRNARGRGGDSRACPGRLRQMGSVDRARTAADAGRLRTRGRRERIRSRRT